MKIYAHLSLQHKNSLRRQIWNRILEVSNLDEEEKNVLDYSEDSKDKNEEDASNTQQKDQKKPKNEIKTKLGKFLFYFKKNWINNYEIKLSEERTNNICESYHAKLWREVNTFNPLMGIITKYFIEEEFLYKLLVSKVSTGSSLVAKKSEK